MTFYEAALRVLEREGKPLHVNAITEAALKDNLLSHVGKSPEEVMQSRLLAMARRRTDRKVVATAMLTYGLVEWGIPEDPVALAASPELPPDGEKPLRPRERHPIPSPDKVRIAGRGERPRKGRREEDHEERRRRRRFPPLPEVAFEILSQVTGPMSAVDLAAAARERELVSEDLGAEALLNALREDNRRRAEAGRKPAFTLGAHGEVSVERAVAGEAPSVELEAAFAYALGVPLTEGKLERGPGATRLVAQAAEHRRQIVRLVRRRLGDMDAFAYERAGLALLEQQGFRDLKVIKRSKDGPLLTARRKDGLTELRWVVQVLKGGPEVEREDVEDLRKDLTQHGAQLGIVLCPAEVTRDARHEAQAGGQSPVLLWCADALAEKHIEAKVGVGSTSIEVWDLDEDFFRRCRDKGREDERSRRGREERPPAPARSPASSAAPVSAPAAPAGMAAAPGAPPVPSEAERQALAERMAQPTAEEREAEERRRREEEKLRAEAHERIEAAEQQARLKRVTT
ncbi:MAG: restriction endonuclease [Deltaproteobacteria bacterium]|nr:restriction endonuclease [Deltaproteobacteria bacterium]